MIIELRKKDYVILIPIALILLAIIVYTYFMMKAPKNNQIKKNKVNGYSSSYITNDKQASIYLSNYYNLINNEIDQAYELLDSGVKEDMDFNSFKMFVSLHDFSMAKIQRFRLSKKNSKDVFDIYDVNNNHIKFITKGIMQYSVIIYN